jgi:hypothetical protein
LSGDKQNPNAVGAIVQVVFENGTSPAKQIHTGAGYWSQDSHTLIFGLKNKPEKIKVIWPGGDITTSDIPEIARDVLIDKKGKLAVNSHDNDATSE